MRYFQVVLAWCSLITFSAYAWGPATHAYVASCVTEGYNNSVIFGAMLPDLNALIRDNSAEAYQLNRLTHREFDRLAPSALATGFKTHNALWGADYYAHLCFDPEAEEIYSTLKIRQLSTEFGITISDAENVFEMCVDIQMRLILGTDWGVRIALAAQASGAEHEQALVDAFASELAARVSGLTLEEAEQDLRTSVQGFRALTIAFGEQLQLSEEEIHEAIPPVLAMYLGCDAASAAAYYNRGLEITADCLTELDRICSEIKVIMPDAFEGEDEGEGEEEPEGEGEPAPVIVDFCRAFRQVYENPLLQGLDPEFAAFVELLNPATADLNGSFAVDSTGGALSIQVNGNGILDAANELGVLARLLNNPEAFRSDIRSTTVDHASALAAWQANRAQLNADIGVLAPTLDMVTPGLKQVLAGFLTLGDGSFTLTSTPTEEDPNLPIIVTGEGSFGLVAALFATLDSMIAGELGSGFANPHLRREDYIALPALLSDNDADGDGFSNREEYGFFAASSCSDKEEKEYKGNNPSMDYAQAALNYRICPECIEYCADCIPQGVIYQVGEDACLKVPGTYASNVPFDWAKDGEGPLFGDRFEGVDCQTLRIFNVTESDSGRYVCTYDSDARQYATSISVYASLPAASGMGMVLLLGLFLAGFFLVLCRGKRIFPFS